MIRTLSPYYVTTPFVSPESSITAPSYTLQIFVWSGAKASPPGTPTRELTKLNYENSTGNGRIDISPVINDEIEIAKFTISSDVAVSSYGDDNKVWVKWQVIYNTGDPLDEDPQLETTKLATKGYSYGDEGENIDNIVTSTVTIDRAFNGGRYIMPIYLQEASTTALTVISYPSNEINESYSFAATTASGSLVKHLVLNIDTTEERYIEVSRAGVKIKTIYIVDEFIFDPVNVVFLNKYGCLESLVLFKERRNKVDVTSKMYEGNNGQPSLGNHQMMRYNINGKKSFTASSGFMFEEQNDKFQELLLSSVIWELVGTTFNPVTIQTSSLEFKTKDKDKIIQYTFTFDYAYTLINTI